MCRFLLVKSKIAIQPKELLKDFSLMCKNNSEWQGDGWGMSWKIEDGGWKIEKSLLPIWEETEKFKTIPKATMFAFHARGASFPKHKDNLDFNQPFIKDDVCFVFNGELYGVNLKAEGTIGSQKIFSLLKNNLDFGTSDLISLQNIRDLLVKNSKSILGCNIAFAHGESFYISCYFDDKKDYYTLRYFSDSNLSIICSEKIGNYKWRDMKKGDVIKL